MAKQLFTQKEIGNVPTGTLVEQVTNPGTVCPAYHQARYYDEPGNPSVYYQVVGSSEYFSIPLWSRAEYLDEFHPLDPRKSAPLQIAKVKVSFDKLSRANEVTCYISAINWPMCELQVCVNSDYVFELDFYDIVVDKIHSFVDRECNAGKAIADKQYLSKTYLGFPEMAAIHDAQMEASKTWEDYRAVKQNKVQ